MEQVIQAAVDRGARDIHVKAGDFVRGRVDGELVQVTKQRIAPEQVRAFLLSVLPTDRVRDQIDTLQDYDCSWGLVGVGRFRVNIMRQRGSFNVALRLLPSEVPTLGVLGLPRELGSVVLERKGAVVVCGPEAMGRSWVLAALVGHINEHSRRLVVTLEDPIEFLHRDEQSSVIQREIGADTESLAIGLRAALRHGPDVIQLCGVSPGSVLKMVLEAVDTGHLVLFGVEAADGRDAVVKLLELFPVDQRAAVRERLASSLRALVVLRRSEHDDSARPLIERVEWVLPGSREDLGRESQKDASV